MLIEDLADSVRSQPLHQALSVIEDRTGYRAMLEQDNSPEALARLENLNELMNAAREAVERGETAGDFLDHAALVAQTDAIDEQAQITLMTLHNAKGLEFPVVFLAGLEERLFPHSRSILNEAAMEEERRLCYVGMTRAEKRLILSWARYRRRFGGGEQERSMPSRFLKEIPENLVISLGVSDDDDDDSERSTPQIDLSAERSPVRQEARKNLYTGKTYNSLENVSQFFKQRGVNVPVRGFGGPNANSASASKTGATTSARRARFAYTRSGEQHRAAFSATRRLGKNRQYSGKASRFRRRNRSTVLPQRPPPQNVQLQQVQ